MRLFVSHKSRVLFQIHATVKTTDQGNWKRRSLDCPMPQIQQLA
jgi:hypothetical protein